MDKIEVAYNLAKIAIDCGWIHLPEGASTEECGAELALLFNSIYEKIS